MLRNIIRPAVLIGDAEEVEAEVEEEVVEIEEKVQLVEAKLRELQ